MMRILGTMDQGLGKRQSLIFIKVGVVVEGKCIYSGKDRINCSFILLLKSIKACFKGSNIIILGDKM